MKSRQATNRLFVNLSIVIHRQKPWKGDSAPMIHKKPNNSARGILMKPQCRLSRNNERSGRSKGGSQLRASGLLYSDTLRVDLHRLQVGAVVHNYKNDNWQRQRILVPLVFGPIDSASLVNLFNRITIIIGEFGCTQIPTSSSCSFERKKIF